jgi:hypothetical protein
MAQEALSQANVEAQTEGRPTTDFTTAIKAQVYYINHYALWHFYHTHFPSHQISQAGSVWRSQLKSMVFNNIHLYGILPSVEEQANMTKDEVIAYVRTAVAALQKDDGYLHQGIDSFVSYIHSWLSKTPANRYNRETRLILIILCIYPFPSSGFSTRALRNISLIASRPCFRSLERL